MRSAIAWFDGKGPMVRHLLPLLPPHRTYVEPFGGGASLLHAKAPSLLEVYNDLNKGVTNFWRVLRDPEQFEQLQRLITLTPYSRAEFLDACAGWEAETDPVQRAYRYYVRVRMAFSANDTGSLGWSFCRTESKRGISASVSKWLTVLEDLPQIHARWRGVQVECDDFRSILEHYDHPQTLFYCDPPYVPETRKQGRYQHELTLTDHEDLIGHLLRLQGMVILSGYAHPVYDPLEAAGWRRLDFKAQSTAVGHTRFTGLIGKGAAKERQARVESIWISPNAQTDRQLTFRDLAAGKDQEAPATEEGVPGD